MGGTSVPMLSDQIAATGYKSVGAEAPPTMTSTANADRSSDSAARSSCLVGGTSVPMISAQVAAS
ncbi:DUF6053 domain-containing protein [Lysobacter enzymogenes]|uniref:DUF6053 domain-containing protein n=1 Tax=Lysobacter enzymogenes TaxID=69 RepID=UPI003D2F7A3D